MKILRLWGAIVRTVHGAGLDWTGLDCAKPTENARQNTTPHIGGATPLKRHCCKQTAMCGWDYPTRKERLYA